MSKPLIIVESPTKIKTLKKYIGKEFNIAATAGHIRDLPVSKLGIDIENDFEAHYTNIKDKSKVIQNLKSSAKDTNDIYLAPDPDREGEAIAFHVMDILKKKGRKFHRVLIHELTQKGITEALTHPTEPDKNKYEAQQTRRKLDRLVGYQISPLLWQKVQRGLSAGRVQSVAVKIICDRERQIRSFIPEEFWTISAILKADTPPTFQAELSRINGKKAKITNEEQAQKITKELHQADFLVDSINKKTIKRNPLPPFITSKLQQDAINRLRFTAKKTMMVAQQLYEGIEIGTKGPEGLITYMRTDSTRIAPDAAHEAMAFINQTMGAEYGLTKPRFFTNKSKSQDAHEAIRPTSVFNSPEKIERYLSKDQFKLYDLIWKRFVASQMAQALIDMKTILIKAGPEYIFSIGGSTVRFPGFLKLYSYEETPSESDKNKQLLPELEQGMLLTKDQILPKQHFTKPPARFSEATLVKELEKNGIGRPSTYASILSVIKDKGYVDLINRFFIPNELGFIVNDLLVSSFPDILNISFTAQLENSLDNVENGTQKELEILKEFYTSFKKELDTADSHMLNMKGVGILTDIPCPACGKPLSLKIGRNGHFIACSAYPDCKFSSNYTRDEKGQIEIAEKHLDTATIKDCIKCGRPMVYKEGKFGKFIACTGYPECKHTESTGNDSTGKDIGVNCPEPGCNGKMMERKSKRGKIFYGCSNYPECTFALWDKPVNKPCPECSSLFLIEKTTKKDGLSLKCPNKACSYKETIESQE